MSLLSKIWGEGGNALQVEYYRIGLAGVVYVPVVQFNDGDTCSLVS